MKRTVAMEIVRAEFAQYGRDTGEASRAYINSRMSRKTYLEMVSEGLEVFEKRQTKGLEKVIEK